MWYCSMYINLLHILAMWLLKDLYLMKHECTSNIYSTINDKFLLWNKNYSCFHEISATCIHYPNKDKKISVSIEIVSVKSFQIYKLWQEYKSCSFKFFYGSWKAAFVAWKSFKYPLEWSEPWILWKNGKIEIEHLTVPAVCPNAVTI